MKNQYILILECIYSSNDKNEIGNILKDLTSKILGDKESDINDIFNIQTNNWIIKEETDQYSVLSLIVYCLLRLNRTDKKYLIKKIIIVLQSFNNIDKSDIYDYFLYYGAFQLSMGDRKKGAKDVIWFLINKKKIVPIEYAISTEALSVFFIQNSDLKTALYFLNQNIEYIAKNLKNIKNLRIIYSASLLSLITKDMNSYLINFEQLNNEQLGNNFLYNFIIILKKLVFDNEKNINEINSLIQNILNNDSISQFLIGIDIFPKKIIDNNYLYTLNKKLLNFNELFYLIIIYLNNYLEGDNLKYLIDCLISWDNYGLLDSKDLKNYDYEKEKINLDYIPNPMKVLNDTIIANIGIEQNILCSDEILEKLYFRYNTIYNLIVKSIKYFDGFITNFENRSIYSVFKGNDSATILNLINQFIIMSEDFKINNLINFWMGISETNINIEISKEDLILCNIGNYYNSSIGYIKKLKKIKQKSNKINGKININENYIQMDITGLLNNLELINFSIRKIDDEYCFDSLIRYWVDFVPIGSSVVEENCVLYADVGNKKSPGIIDHRIENMLEGSSCGMFMKNPNYYINHIKKNRNNFIEIRLHENPDFDCISSYYSIQEFLDGFPRKNYLEILSMYVTQINQGVIPNPDSFMNSLYGIFIGHIATAFNNVKKNDFLILKEGLKVIDAAFYIAEKDNIINPDFTNIFENYPNIFKIAREYLKNDIDLFLEDCSNGIEYDAFLKKDKEKIKVSGLFLNNPKSGLFKLWARNPLIGMKKYDFINVLIGNKENKNRYIISVDPESLYTLNGLGELLEKREKEKRIQLNLQRPIHPIRYPSDNSDPWYFGQGHNWTIIDSPNCGSILSKEEVIEIHKNWT